MPEAGMLVQMDSSQHHWLAYIPEKWWLIAAIDDASNEVPFAFFSPSDTTFANMHVLRGFLEKKGLFDALYVDKASHFITTRRGGFNHLTPEEQDNTNIAKALDELGITIIPAHSPQAKGRIERLFGFLQDRLINEMKLNKIQDYQAANKFLVDVFLPQYNKKYTHDIPGHYKPLPKSLDLDLVFTCRLQRKVKNDNTISLWGTDLQIPRLSSWRTLARASVEVRFDSTGNLWILFKGKVILKKKRFLSQTQMKSLFEEEYISQKIIAS